MRSAAGPIERLDRLPVPDTMVQSPEPYDLVSVVVAETRDLLRGFYERARLPREAVMCVAATDLLRDVLSEGFTRYERTCGWVREDIAGALTLLREIGAGHAAEVLAGHVREVDHWIGSLVGRKARLTQVDRKFRLTARARLEHFFLYEFSFHGRLRDHLMARGVVREVPWESHEAEMWRIREGAPNYHRLEQWMLESGDPIRAFIIDHCRRTGRRLHRYIGHSPEFDIPATTPRVGVRHHCELSDGLVDFIADGTGGCRVERIDRETQRPITRLADAAQ